MHMLLYCGIGLIPFFICLSYRKPDTDYTMKILLLHYQLAQTCCIRVVVVSPPLVKDHQLLLVESQHITSKHATFKKGVDCFCDDDDKLNVKSTKNTLPLYICVLVTFPVQLALSHVLIMNSVQMPQLSCPFPIQFPFSTNHLTNTPPITAAQLTSHLSNPLMGNVRSASLLCPSALHSPLHP